jgi:hypothetical protein
VQQERGAGIGLHDHVADRCQAGHRRDDHRHVGARAGGIFPIDVRGGLGTVEVTARNATAAASQPINGT